MTPIDVSYVVAAHDAAETLEPAVRSALAQQDAAVEVIVVDDASRDATSAIAARLAAADPRVRALSRAANGGPSAARNDGIAAARGRFVGVLDADDALEPRRTRTLLDLAALTGAEIVADDLLRLDARGAVASRALPEGPTAYAVVLDPAAYCRDNVPMERGFGSGYLKPLFARDFLAAAGLAYDPRVRVGEDFLFCLEAMLAGARYIATSQAGYRYAARPGSLSHRIGPERIDALACGLDRLAERRADAVAARDLAPALAAYRAGLARARAYLDVAETAKTRGFLRAAARAGRDPSVWGLTARFGAGIAATRLRRALAARGAGNPAAREGVRTPDAPPRPEERKHDAA